MLQIIRCRNLGKGVIFTLDKKNYLMANILKECNIYNERIMVVWLHGCMENVLYKFSNFTVLLSLNTIQHTIVDLPPSDGNRWELVFIMNILLHFPMIGPLPLQFDYKGMRVN